MSSSSTPAIEVSEGSHRAILGKKLGDIGHRQREQPEKEVRHLLAGISKPDLPRGFVHQKLDGELARDGAPPRPGLHEEALL